MSELNRSDIVSTRDELRRDTRREWRLLLKAAVGFAILAGIVWARVVFFE